MCPDLYRLVPCHPDPVPASLAGPRRLAPRPLTRVPESVVGLRARPRQYGTKPARVPRPSSLLVGAGTWERAPVPQPGVRSPTPHSLRARRHHNSNAAREHLARSSLVRIGRRNGGVPAPSSIVSRSAPSICEQRNQFQSPCDPPLTVPVLRSYLPNGLQQ